jgi:pimeloyl-ACP methyl ester carboxylesterase
MLAPTYAGAVEPERETFVESLGLRVHVIEWGDPAAPPVLMCHGFWDHARSFAVLGPLLASRYRAVAMDARGHGESEWAGAYSWHGNIHGVVDVLRWLGSPTHLVGHSMGGGHVVDAARALPELVGSVVNIDGFGPPPLTPAEEAGAHERFASYLDSRRAVARRPDWRPYRTFDELVERRRAQNPRLPIDWLRYFVFHAARRAPDGWRWKADPTLAQGFGPWRPEWIGHGYARLAAPMLAVVGSENDTWGPLPEPIIGPRLAGVRRLERATVAGAGHFVHMEQPADTARLILDFFEAGDDGSV